MPVGGINELFMEQQPQPREEADGHNLKTACLILLYDGKNGGGREFFRRCLNLSTYLAEINILKRKLNQILYAIYFAFISKIMWKRIQLGSEI